MYVEEHLDEAVADAEDKLFPDVTDARLVKTVIKIRDKIAAVNKEYDEILKNLKEQKKQVEREILERLQQRGATQTKTDFGTSFITEAITFTIADDAAFGRFVLDQQDYEFYQKRPKKEHIVAWMTEHGGELPPGLSVFREYEINTRVPTKKGIPA